MICLTCQAKVDDDLIFCTNCGARLYENTENAPTIAINDSVVTQVSKPQPQKSSKTKWLVLAVILLAAPAALLGAYIFLKKSGSPQNVQNSGKPAPTRKSDSNQNNSSNVASGNSGQNTDSNSVESNENANSGNSKETVFSTPREIFNEQIEIAPGEHIAYPFKLDSKAKITGDLQTLRGDPVLGFVYFQKEYDEHFPDATFKVFSFDGANPQIEQTLVAGEYVLVFLNSSQTATTIKGKINVTPETER